YRRAKINYLYSLVLLHKNFKDGVYQDKKEYEFTKVKLYKNVANNDIKAGYFNEAKIYLDSALSAFEGLKSDPYYAATPMMAALQNTLGEYYIGMGDDEKAKEH